ncbi:DUF58 domain-containing protein [Marinilactibacillus sp. GCM10026970]|uniref:DUF58 domain-containing protein n=1 Tax=Marinilactibacillus sp. GCM10026970 TaxID=3252642 RepID=UPI003612990B
MKQRFINWRGLTFVLLYFFTILYTLTFPSSVSWFIFYSFSLVLLVAFFSSRLKIYFKNIQWVVTEDNRLDLSFTLYRRWHLLFLLSSFELILTDQQGIQIFQTVYPDLFLKNHSEFRALSQHMTRGHYEQLTVQTRGLGLFGLFRHRFTHSLSVDFAIYPKKAPQERILKLLSEQAIRLTDLDSLSHAFEVKELRAYQPRDAIGSIDWKSSLKREQWMIKEYDREDHLSISLYFVGFSSSRFEDLLSLAYSLDQYLSVNSKNDLHLLGSFNGQTTKHSHPDDYLTIQPSEDDQRLLKLLGPLDTFKTTILIIAPRNISLPDTIKNTPNLFILDERQLNSLKGGAEE